MVCEPLAGWRQVTVTERRPAVDVAHVLQEWVEGHDAQAAKIVLVLDNLPTPTPASLYEAFAPAAARRVRARLERHDTPKHGSGFKRVETELSVLATQCVERRMPAPTILTQAVAAWERHRNTAQCRVDWHFTTHDAHIKLKRLYPSMQLG